MVYNIYINESIAFYVCYVRKICMVLAYYKFSTPDFYIKILGDVYMVKVFIERDLIIIVESKPHSHHNIQYYYFPLGRSRGQHLVLRTEMFVSTPITHCINEIRKPLLYFLWCTSSFFIKICKAALSFASFGILDLISKMPLITHFSVRNNHP